MPQMGYGTKTDRLTDCQSQCDFDFDLDYWPRICLNVFFWLRRLIMLGTDRSQYENNNMR
jgi:hypothetical protein